MRWLGWDALVVLVFAGIGRASHDEGLTVGGWAHTAWPFLVGLVVGWLLALATHRTPGGLAGGAAIWVSTVAVGMLLRTVTGAGTAAAFVVVATVFLGSCLLVPRAVARRISASR